MEDRNLNLDPKPGNIPASPGSSATSLTRLQFYLGQLAQMRRNRWQRMLREQLEQLDRLAALIAPAPLAPLRAGPDFSVLAHHRNARERRDLPAEALRPRLSPRILKMIEQSNRFE